MDGLFEKAAYTILSEGGLVCFILFLIILYLLYTLREERNDRRAAWRAYNQLAEKTNEMLRGLTNVLEVTKEKVK